MAKRQTQEGGPLAAGQAIQAPPKPPTRKRRPHPVVVMKPAAVTSPDGKPIEGLWIDTDLEAKDLISARKAVTKPGEYRVVRVLGTFKASPPPPATKLLIEEVA